MKIIAQTNTYEVARLIHSLSKDKSPGSDDILTKHILCMV